MQDETGFGLTRPAWALAFGLPAAEPEDLRPPRPRSRLARASHFQAARGRRLHGTSRLREHCCWHPSSPQARSHPAPTLLRASDWSGALLAARPQTRKLRAKYQNSEAKNVVKQTTPSTHPSTPSEVQQTSSVLLHATKPGRCEFKNHLLCQS